MLEILYLNVSQVSLNIFRYFLNTVSEKVRSERLRYISISDQILKLFSKLIIQLSFERDRSFDWSELKVSESGKPYINFTLNFNISHSGTIVMVAFSERLIGIDIESIIDVNIKDLIPLFQADEVQYIVDNKYSLDSLYTVWTRKEAFLKAISIGLTDFWLKQSCIQSSMRLSEEWHIRSDLLYSLKCIRCLFSKMLKLPRLK